MRICRMDAAQPEACWAIMILVSVTPHSLEEQKPNFRSMDHTRSAGFTCKPAKAVISVIRDSMSIAAVFRKPWEQFSGSMRSTT